jgi:hypothetical protein
VIAPRTILAVLLALSASVLAQEPPERTTTAVVYGDEACPKPSDEEEIVVCARRPERERYRIPKELRGKGEPLSETSWGSRNELLEEAARVNLPGSCSTVGSYGQSGCQRQFVDQWYKDMRGKRAR